MIRLFRPAVAGEGELLRIAPALASYGDNFAQKPVFFLIRTGSEIQFDRRTRAGIVAEVQSPQAINLQRMLLRIDQGSFKPTGYRIEGMNPAVAEISNEYPMAKHAKVTGRQSHAPRCVQKVPMLQALPQPSFGTEDRHEPPAQGRVLRRCCPPRSWQTSRPDSRPRSEC